MDQSQQQQQPQDVLAEARKNLQVLIDSGLSRDLLHQLVDGGQSLSLSIPTQSSLLQQQQPQQQSQSQSQTPRPQSQPQSLASPPPPPPQCPPPPLPRQTQAQEQQQQQQQHHHHQQQQNQHQQNSHQSAVSPVTATPTRDIKPEARLPDDASAMFVYPPGAPFAHRPRISVSSTSSGSSGHSIWSSHSTQSNMSWASSGSRMQAPLPLPPQTNSPTAVQMLNGASVGAVNKQNIYWCTSCETSFKRKYDWKRHEDEFHERWRKYPCPEPGCNRSFWGSNSFNQHHKQCHGCTTCPHAEKVVKFLRKRKYWACGFCSALHPARERHVEHVARHFESGMTKGEWMHSRVVYGLLHQPLIHEAWDALVTSKSSEYNGRRPRFSWHPSRTGRAQGFLEKENPGQLQDLLEFFSGDEGDAQWIASVTYDLADIVMDQVAPSHSHSHAHFSSHSAIAPHPYSHEPRVSFTPVPSQPMLPPADPNNQHSYVQAFQNPMFMTSPPFGQPGRPSPTDSASHSPMNSSHHSPIAPSHSPGIKQESQHAHSTDNGESIMDIEYSPAPVVFDDWESTTGLITGEPTQQTQSHGAQAGWGMMQYFSDPRVTS